MSEQDKMTEQETEVTASGENSQEEKITSCQNHQYIASGRCRILWGIFL